MIKYLVKANFHLVAQLQSEFVAGISVFSNWNLICIFYISKVDFGLHLGIFLMQCG